jgi:hypothetical protein
MYKSLFRQTKLADNQKYNHDGEEKQNGAIKLAKKYIVALLDALA